MNAVPKRFHVSRRRDKRAEMLGRVLVSRLESGRIDLNCIKCGPLWTGSGEESLAVLCVYQPLPGFIGWECQRCGWAGIGFDGARWR